MSRAFLIFKRANYLSAFSSFSADAIGASKAGVSSTTGTSENN